MGTQPPVTPQLPGRCMVHVTHLCQVRKCLAALLLAIPPVHPNCRDRAPNHPPVTAPAAPPSYWGLGTTPVTSTTAMLVTQGCATEAPSRSAPEPPDRLEPRATRCSLCRQACVQQQCTRTHTRAPRAVPQSRAQAEAPWLWKCQQLSAQLATASHLRSVGQSVMPQGSREQAQMRMKAQAHTHTHTRIGTGASGRAPGASVQAQARLHCCCEKVPSLEHSHVWFSQSRKPPPCRAMGAAA